MRDQLLPFVEAINEHRWDGNLGIAVRNIFGLCYIQPEAHPYGEPEAWGGEPQGWY